MIQSRAVLDELRKSSGRKGPALLPGQALLCADPTHNSNLGFARYMAPVTHEALVGMSISGPRWRPLHYSQEPLCWQTAAHTWNSEDIKSFLQEILTGTAGQFRLEVLDKASIHRHGAMNTADSVMEAVQQLRA